jgi:hypothetical protein
MPTATDLEFYTIGDLARHFGVLKHHARRTITRGFFKEPARVGGFRLVRADELDAFEAALRKAGYLREEIAVAK